MEGMIEAVRRTYELMAAAMGLPPQMFRKEAKVRPPPSQPVPERKAMHYLAAIRLEQFAGEGSAWQPIASGRLFKTAPEAIAFARTQHPLINRRNMRAVPFRPRDSACPTCWDATGVHGDAVDGCTECGGAGWV
jgi:hypothetical protein